jgi:hypothetical protein
MQSSIQGTDKTECVICWEDIEMSECDRFQCSQCESRVCPTCLLKINPNGVCVEHVCMHIKCPVCRKPSDVGYQTIERIVLKSKSGKAAMGRRHFKRKFEQISEDLSLVTVVRRRIISRNPTSFTFVGTAEPNRDQALQDFLSQLFGV